MQSCLGAPVLCWGLLVCLILFRSISHTLANSPEARGSGVMDPGGMHSAVKGMRGDSVWFHVVPKSGEMLEEITWSIGPESAYTYFLRVNSGPDSPKWLGLQDKFKGRVHVPNMTSLMIESLIPQDRGQYRAQAMLTGGLSHDQFFHLSVYEPVPAPHLMANSTSLMSGWCNISLECNVTDATLDLNVTWKSTGLNGELKQGGTLQTAPTSWTLDVSLPMSQSKASLSCVVSNQADQKTATLDLGDICVQESHGQAEITIAIVVTLLVVLLLVAGIFLWRKRGKQKKNTKDKETEGGAALKEDHGANDDDIDYAQLTQQETQGSKKGGGEQHLEEKESVMTIYSKVRNPGQPMKII